MFMHLEHQRIFCCVLITGSFLDGEVQYAGSVSVGRSVASLDGAALHNETQDMHWKRSLSLVDDVCKSVSLTGVFDFKPFAGAKSIY